MMIIYCRKAIKLEKKIKMQLPGFEPGTSRVWGERDNQLHHSCQLITWDYEP